MGAKVAAAMAIAISSRIRRARRRVRSFPAIIAFIDMGTDVDRFWSTRK